VSGMLSTVPVYAVMVEDLGERGAEYVATKLLKEYLISDFHSSKKLANNVKSDETPATVTNSSNVSLMLTAVTLGVIIGFVVAKLR
jgi:hypothetical protein